MSSKAWKLKNRDKVNAYARKYREVNGEKCRERVRECYAKSKERHLEYSREWRAKNPDKQKATAKRFYDKNREQLLTKSREFRKKNPVFVLMRRIENRTLEWIRHSMRKKTKTHARQSADYLVWQAGKRGIDVSEYHIHHLKSCANYSPTNEHDFIKMHHPSNLWLIAPIENARINDGESPKEMIEEASKCYSEWRQLGRAIVEMS